MIPSVLHLTTRTQRYKLLRRISGTASRLNGNHTERQGLKHTDCISLFTRKHVRLVNAVVVYMTYGLPEDASSDLYVIFRTELMLQMRLLLAPVIITVCKYKYESDQAIVDK